MRLFLCFIPFNFETGGRATKTQSKAMVTVGQNTWLFVQDRFRYFKQLFLSLPHTFSLHEAFVEECDFIGADLLQNDLDIQGKFVTVACMLEGWGCSELLG